MTSRIGILGCGTIAAELASAIDDGTIPWPLAAVYDRGPESARELADEFPDDRRPAVADDLDGLIDRSDIVVETAGQGAVADAAVPILEAGCDLMLLSVGALADDDLRRRVLEAAAAETATVYAPSGAIAGVDAIKAAALTGDLERVSLRTRKPPAGLAGAPYVEANGIDLGGIAEETVVFEGTATEAAAAFPSNINVAVALSLAGIGTEATTVTIVADPDEDNNVHQIEATGGMGRIETAVHNVPSPTNPKTSYLAALSAIEKLRDLSATLRVGT
jgi:aspartate dehydrogenase